MEAFCCNPPKVLSLVVISAAFLAAGAANATSFTIYDGLPYGSLGSGWVEEQGAESPGTIFTGTSDNILGIPGYTDYRNYFIFDFSSVAGQSIAGATLTISAGNGDYRSYDASETYVISDFLDPGALAGACNINPTSDCAAIYDDLGSGNEYGQTTVFGSYLAPMPLVEIVLNTQAIADINQALSSSSLLFGIGGKLTTADPTLTQGLWGASGTGEFSRQPAAYLTLETMPVPLPPTALLMLPTLLVARRLRLREQQSFKK